MRFGFRISDFGFSHRRGNVILLAIFMLGGGIVGALTLALIVVSELRQAKNLDSSLVAHFGAESGLEESLYQVRKEQLCVNTPQDCAATSYVLRDLPAGSACSGGTPGCSPQSYERTISPPTEQLVPLLREDDTFQLDIDPTNPPANLQVTWKPATATLPFLEVSYVVGFDPPLSGGVTTQVCRPNSCNLHAPYSCVLDAGTSTTCYYPTPATPLTLDLSTTDGNGLTGGDCAGVQNTDCELGGTVQQLRLKALQSDITALTLIAGGAALGNYVEVKSRRSEGGVAQNLLTVIPKEVAAFGFTDYVVFSEQDIVK